MSHSPRAKQSNSSPGLEPSAIDTDLPTLCPNCVSNVWSKDMLDTLIAYAAQDGAFHPYRYQIFAGDLRDSVHKSCSWCSQLGACINGHVFVESAENTLTGNTNDTVPLIPRQENSIQSLDGQSSSDDATAADQTAEVQEVEDNKSQSSEWSYSQSSMIASGWSDDPASIWAADDDPDAAIYTSDFEITMTFEKTADGLYAFLTATIESIGNAHGGPVAVLSGENAATVHYCLEETAAIPEALTFPESRGTWPLGSAQNTARAAAWLSEVTDLRKEPSEPARKRVRLTTLPTRLLMVEKNTIVKVVHSASEVAQDAQYTCLSYVWGPNQRCMLTTQNTARLSAGFDVTELPQTIRDALLVTENLGYRYMWVDALCIVQDSEEDKRRELPMMGSIYKNSAVTISAAVASAATEGFLHVLPTGRHQTPSFPMGFYDENGDIAKSVTLSRPFVYNPSRDRINSRAWTFQEHLLSERIISFTYAGLEFIDRSKTTFSERSAAARTSRDPEMGELYSTLSWELPYFSLAVTREHVREVWLSVRREYSLRHLSNPEDKLIAIAAVTAELSPVYGEYIAGLWKEDLFLELQWRRPNPEFDSTPDEETRKSLLDNQDLLREIRRPRPADYRAPSWSWASIDGETIDPTEEVLQRTRSAFDFSIISCSAQPVTEDYPFGAVKDGILTARGRLRIFKWRPSDSPLIDGCDGFLCLDSEVDKAYGVAYGGGKIDAREPELVSGTEVQCLAMTSMARTSDSGLEGCEGLILLQISSSVYRRAGLFNISSKAIFDDIEPATVSIA